MKANAPALKYSQKNGRLELQLSHLTYLFVKPMMFEFIQLWIRMTSGYVPMPTKKHPPNDSLFEVLRMSINHPAAAITKQVIRKIPLFLSLSEQ